MAIPDNCLQLFKYRMSYERYQVSNQNKGKQNYCTNSYEQTENENSSNIYFRLKLKCDFILYNQKPSCGCVNASSKLGGRSAEGSGGGVPLPTARGLGGSNVLFCDLETAYFGEF